MNFYSLRLAFLLAASAAAFLTSPELVWGQSPKLVVVVTVDQLPYAYLNRFSKGLSDDGFYRRVFKEGASYRECNYRHAFTFTGPGHATISTGADPRSHGVVGNSWYVREDQKEQNCVFDPTVDIIGSANTRGASPRRLIAPTLGDALKLASGGKSKVFSIALKDRAAILTAGRLADGVFWFDMSSGNWVTSTAYASALPGYLRNVNETDQAKQYGGQKWELLNPPTFYALHRDDDDAVESPRANMTRSFPHEMPAADDKDYMYHLGSSPFFNRYIIASAMRIVQSEELGADDAPDLLYLNLSSTDYVGHNFGPYSLEVEDMFYRTDSQLGKLAEDLDEFVGVGKWTIALTSDHGVAPIPAFAERLGLIDKFDPLDDKDKMKAVLESQLTSRFGETAESDLTYVESVSSHQVYLREKHPNLDGASFSEAQRLVRTIVLAHPAVAAAATRDELLASGGAARGLEGMISRAFHPDRSGDVIFVQAPYQYDTGGYSASHGSPWGYDTHVPLMFLGNVKSLMSDRKVDPTMLAPTLARLLGVAPPAACKSPPLVEVLSP